MTDHVPRGNRADVHALRRLACVHRRLAVLLVAATLAMKLLVPGGYMLASDHGRLTVTLCSGYGGQPVTIEMPGMMHHAPAQDHDKAEMPCAFAGLSAHAVSAIVPILLIAAIAFVMALARHRPAVPRIAAIRRLRPPPHAPPLAFAA